MSFSIRREQGLLIVVLLLGVWIYTSSPDPFRATRVIPKTKDYEPAGAPRVVLAPPLQYRHSGRDGFVEPSESAPLPPRELKPPELEPLPVVLPPLIPGLAPAHYHRIRIAGGVVEAIPIATLEGGDGGGSLGQEVEGSAPVPNAGGIAQGTEEGPERTYDRLETATGTYYGTLKNQNRLELHGKSGPFLHELEFDVFNRTTGKLINAAVFKGTEVQRVLLADNLRNQIALRKRDLGNNVDSLPGRAALLDWVLAGARENSWLYKEAETQARDFLRISGDKLDGWLWMARVFREQGDLTAELEFYQGLPAELQGSPFQLRGLGRIKALLQLDGDAEADLRRAVSVDGNDPRSQDALARFLISRSRLREALPHAEAGRRASMIVAADAERFAIIETLLTVQLGLGDLDGAEQTFASLPTGESLVSRRQYLRGAIRYAAMDRAAARSALELGAAAAPGEAALGLAVLQMLDGQWTTARRNLLSLADQHPILRARALATLGLLYERTGNGAEALARLEEAVVADPQDPWVLYTLGRLRRSMGNPGDALEALESALRIDDELTEAMAEVVLARMAVAESAGGGQAAESILAAVRFADRLVSLDQRGGRSPRFIELQGLAHLNALDNRGARRAFSAAADQSLYCEIGLGLVDYAQNLVEDARGRFDELVKRLGISHPSSRFVQGLVAQIDDHAQKVQIRDGFERDELGNLWEYRRNAGVDLRLVDRGASQGEKVLTLRGQFGTTADPVRVMRRMEPAGNFLSAEIDIQVGGRHDGLFAGLVLEKEVAGAARSETDFAVRLGFRGRQPFLLIRDGRESSARDDKDRARFDPVSLAVQLDPSATNRLQLELVPKGDNARAFELQARINGMLVHQREIQMLNRSTRQGLLVGISVEGRPGSTIDTTYDNFRMVRRQGDT